VNAVPAMIASPFTQTHNKYALYLQVKGSSVAAADDALLLEDKHVDKHRLIISPRYKNSFLSMDHQSPPLFSLPSSSSSHLFSSVYYNNPLSQEVWGSFHSLSLSQFPCTLMLLSYGAVVSSAAEGGKRKLFIFTNLKMGYCI
jgi:hypothetical protein